VLAPRLLAALGSAVRDIGDLGFGLGMRPETFLVRIISQHLKNLSRKKI
jgi:hypothetical protein